MPEWTREQSLAIDGRSGSLLVSAAAGSGKTTVLVERVIRRLLDEENPCPADELVIVTFTRAAAAQMKERIDAALSKRIAENNSPWLMKQQLLLQSAKICTIDSFCGDLVRENFHQLGISADYKIIDDSDNARYEERAVNNVLGEMYAEGGSSFTDLADLISAGGSDSALADAIKTLYTNISSYPFPKKVLGALAAEYNGAEPVQNSSWGKAALSECADLVTYSLHLIEDARRIAADSPDSGTVFDAVFEEDTAYYNQLLSLIDSGEWDRLNESLAKYKYVSFPQAKKADPLVKEAVKLRRDTAKETVVKKASKFICTTAAQFEEDRAVLCPCAAALLECVARYSAELKRIKAADEALNFNDIEHLALELLVEADDSGVCKTPLALSLSQTYKEIMVDEYQDTNELQDMIFSAVSNDESNLFFVGDVKQSIYRFRQAMPEIFLRRRGSVPEFDGTNYPAAVMLSANFRSRKGVTDAVNFVFEQIMSKEFGEIDYGDGERLNALADYPEHDEADTELLLREKSGTESEPEFVAKYIKKLLASGRMMRGSDGQRPVRADDICILTQYKTRMADYQQALESIGINAVCAVDGELGGSAEVRIVLSLLRVLDNPLLDIDLTAVLMSPLFGFTTDELAKIRLGVRRGTPVYRSVVAEADNGNVKCFGFLEKINSIRRVSIGMGAADFVRRLFDETGIFSVACALSEPEQRIANLRSLLDLAGKFDSSGGCGLSAFLRFIDGAKCKGTDFGVSDTSSAVKIMNIHKSKGLEFGICILADLSSRLEPQRPPDVALSKTLGIGLKRRDEFSGKMLTTLQHTACTLSNKRMKLSEAVRVLYVAMTRAKEQMTVVCTVSKLNEKLKAAPLAAPCGKGIEPGYLLTSSTAVDWLLPAFARHGGAPELHTVGTPLPSGFLLHPDFKLKVGIYDGNSDEAVESASEDSDILEKSKPDAKLKKLIEERINYVYPYSALSRAVAKKQASGFLDESFDDRFFASSRPAFMNSGGMTAAQKGTLTHKFMQLCDLNNDDVSAQVKELTAQGHFTEKEAKELNLDEIQAFFSSDICGRIRSSQNVMREKKFAMLLPVTELYRELPDELSNESVVVQGMVDLAFVEDGKVIVVDYKTDRGVGDIELRERHFEQLNVYVKAIERCTDFEVSAAYIYSLPLKKEIKVIQNGR